MRRPGVTVMAFAVAGCGPSNATQEPESSSGVVEDGGDVESTEANVADSTTGDLSCPRRIDASEPTQISLADLGRMQVYDFDRDGLEDLVGTNGEIGLQRGDHFEWVDGPGSLVATGCRAGQFDGAPGTDLVCSSEIALFVHVGGALGPVVETPVAEAGSIDARDMDGDGIDDLVRNVDNRRVQVWRGSSSGVFEQTAELSPASYARGAFAVLDPPRVDLVVTDTSSLYVYVGDEDGGVTLLESTKVPSSGLVMVGRDGDRDVVLTNSWISQFVDAWGYASAVVRGDDGALRWQPYDLSPDMPLGNPVVGDFDDDGQLDLITSRTYGADARTDIACGDGSDFVECGHAPYAHERQWSVVLPSPWRIVDTGEDGTWVTQIAPALCI